MGIAVEKPRRVVEENTLYEVEEQEPAGGETQASREHREKLKEVARHVLQQVRSAQMHQIPMLPNIASRAMELASKSDVGVRELESIIQPDAMITARVLAIANSPLYGSAAAVKSLRNAIMRLGVVLMRDILQQTVAEAHIFRGAAEKLLRWQRVHAVAVAYLSREIESKCKVKSDSIFLCGLMHDIGELILYQTFDSKPPPGVKREDVSTIIQLIHPHIGYAVAEKWRLPESIREAVRRHHVYRGYEAGGGYSGVGNIISCADHLAQQLGLGERGGTAKVIDEDAPLEIPQSFQDLGIDGATYAGLFQRAREIKEQLGL